MKARGEFYNLLGALLLILTVYPFFEGRSLAGMIFAAFFTWVLVSAVLVVSGQHRRNRFISLVLGVPAILLLWAGQFIDNNALDTIGFLFMTMFTFFAVYCMVSFILKAKRVTGNILAGAASAYLLLGISWGILYAFLEFLRPGSFSIPAVIHHDLTRIGWSIFNYFSFVTLTTLGYGDVSPLSTHAQSLAITEAVTGVLFTALLISRLVGMYLYQLGREGA